MFSFSTGDPAEMADLTEEEQAARRLVGLLAVTQTVGYGVLFYSFSILLTPTAAALHTSVAVVTGALTVSLLAGAVSGVPIGRWLDRHGGRALMTTGSVAATLLVVAWSRVGNVAELYVLWLAIGVVSPGVLYETALPVVVSWFDDVGRAGGLLAVTVVAGFSSTVFLPLAAALNDTFGWRDAILILGVGHGVVTIPLHAAVRRPRDRTARSAATSVAGADRAAIVRRALRDSAFWLLGAAFVTQACSISAVSVLLVAMLREMGHGPGFAATIAGLLGALSVTGRLATAAAGRRFSTAVVTAVAFTVQAAGAALLPIAGHSAIGAIGCVLALGLGLGVSTIARPTLLADRYGTTAYATLSAIWGVPLTLARALAPLAAVLLWHAAGLTAALDGVAMCCALGAAGLAISGRSGPSRRDVSVGAVAMDGSDAQGL